VKLSISRTLVATPFGSLLVEASERGLRRVGFVTTGEKPRALADKPIGVLREASGQLEEYFAGNRRVFELPLDLDVSEFAGRVLSALARVPYGETTSYGELAEAAGAPGAARAVGTVMSHNPLPIVLPCHRVIASDGTLGGYGGTLEHSSGELQLKRDLLELEGALRR
jgi:methylated-DNA-[protein]-cysteine S-methyltransferase